MLRYVTVADESVRYVEFAVMVDKYTLAAAAVLIYVTDASVVVRNVAVDAATSARLA
jgi:hypothetical protein